MLFKIVNNLPSTYYTLPIFDTKIYAYIMYATSSNIEFLNGFEKHKCILHGTVGFAHCPNEK